MIVVDDRVNSVLAAVLSASIAPIHGALAQEETPIGQRAVVSLPVKAEFILVARGHEARGCRSGRSITRKNAPPFITVGASLRRQRGDQNRRVAEA